MRTILLLPLALLLLSTCHKPQPEPDAVPLPAELKAYALFQPGTHWIYQDSASGQLDSIWVTSTEMSVYRREIPEPPYLVMKYENFRMRTASSLGGAEKVYNVFRMCGLPYRESLDNLGPCWRISRAHYRPGSTDDAEGADVLPYALAPDQPYTQGGQFGYVLAYRHGAPTTVKGRVYTDLLRVRLSFDGSEQGYVGHYFWAPGQGIVLRRSGPVGRLRTWVLVRSRIVQ